MEYVSPGDFGPDRRKKKKFKREKKRRAGMKTPLIDEDVERVVGPSKEEKFRKKTAGKTAIGMSLTGTMGKSATAVRDKRNKDIEAAIEREMKGRKKKK